ncbi:MAG: hypothetical protein GX879_09785 [Bacteroidales bacterium]|nr:hypothetical protein [Bacteroidales bacterium]
MTNHFIVESKKYFYLLFLVIISFATSNNLQAQRSGAGEGGIMLGASYYMGDLNLARHFYEPNLAIGGFYKHHVNSRLNIRAGFYASSLSGYDKDFKSAFQQQRNAEFSTSLMEISLQTEFNFLPYLVGELRKRNYTPYLQTGLTYYLTPNSENVSGFAIPVGMGFRVNITRRLILAAEWSFRRTFTDLLDNTTGEDLFIYGNNEKIPVTEENEFRQKGFNMNKDWYSYGAVSLSYAFSWGGFPCPAYDVY